MKTNIKTQKENTIDWTKNPQLVISGDGTVVLVTDASDGTFYGMVVSGTKIGDCSAGFIKSAFKPFHGTIELSND